LDCKGKNYISNKKAFALFLAITTVQKPLFVEKTAPKQPKNSHFLLLKNLKLLFQRDKVIFLGSKGRQGLKGSTPLAALLHNTPEKAEQEYRHCQHPCSDIYYIR